MTRTQLIYTVCFGTIALFGPSLFFFFFSENSGIQVVAEEKVVHEELPMATTSPFAEDTTDDVLPDLIPFPAEDVDLVHDENGKTLLRFSTTYYNAGAGPLELIADSATAGIEEDLERTVFQRIYQKDGGYRDVPSGIFLWHEAHQHFHFADFVSYVLTPLGETESADSSRDQKATFCVRDVSRIGDATTDTPDAGFRFCGRNRQGVSVGWGDTYFFDYPDQNLDVTDIPSGTYALSFVVNPEHVFEEVTEENNRAHAVLSLNQEKGLVSIVRTLPSTLPKIEHVYPDQQF